MSDAFFDTEEEALREVRRRKSSPEAGGMIVRREKSGYGNWRVSSISAELMVDFMIDGPYMGWRRKSAWADKG